MREFSGSLANMLPAARCLIRARGVWIDLDGEGLREALKRAESNLRNTTLQHPLIHQKIFLADSKKKLVKTMAQIPTTAPRYKTV